MPGDCESNPVDGPDRDEEEAEEQARRSILQVKDTVERCLRQGMDKAEMFRVIREEELPPAIAFAVYKQLRDQNHGFFKEYYNMIELKEQRQRFDRLIQAYRARASNVANNTAAAISRAPAPASRELDILVHEAWPDKRVVQDWSDDETHENAQVDSARDGGGDPLAWRLPAGQPVINHGHTVAGGVLPGLPCPLPDAGAQQLGYHQQPVGDGGVEVAWHQQEMHPAPFQELHCQEQPVANDGGGVQDQEVAWQQQGEMHLPAAQVLLGQDHEQLVMAVAGFDAVPLASAVGLSSDSMMASCCPPSTHGGLWYGWHGRQAEALERWPSASADPLSLWQQPPINGPGQLSSSTLLVLPQDDPMEYKSFQARPR
ncbi:hypothetical protein ACP4OV_004188 [Aristida adscensionis]